MEDSAYGAGAFSSTSGPSPFPLAASIVPERFVGAMLLTCACQDLVELPSDIEVADASVALNTKSDYLFVHGGQYRHESREMYREQALLGVAIVAQALEEMGVPRGRIHHRDFRDGYEGPDPAAEVRRWISRLPGGDCLVYYVGPTVREGAWGMAWRNAAGELKRALVQPEHVIPEPEAGSPGERLLIADGPFTARAWLRPEVRRRGVAAWADGALASTASGPALARWFAGQIPGVPRGAVAFTAPPEDAGLRRLPTFRRLFWSTLPDVETSSKCVWELEEFLGAPTQRERRLAANAEALVHGTSALLVAMLVAHGAAADDALLLQVFWVLHSLVLSTSLERWVGTMDDLARVVLDIPGRRAPCSSAVLAAALALAAACCSRCPRCREEFAVSGAPSVFALVLEALGCQRLGEGPEADEEQRSADAGAAAAGCRLAAQVTSHRALDATEHARLLGALQLALCRDRAGLSDEELAAEDDLQAAAAEALVFACVRSNDVKQMVLHSSGRLGRLRAALQGAGAPAACGKLLNLVRSLATTEPSSEVIEAFSADFADVVVKCLRRFPRDAGVQRWGLASLGALAVCDSSYGERIRDGGIPCAMWAMSDDAVSGNLSVQQEALFCCHSLLPTCKSGLQDGGAELAGLVAGAITCSLRRLSQRSASTCGHSECTAWGLKVMERLCAVKRGPTTVEPYAVVLVEAMLSPELSMMGAVAGSAAISLLAGGSATAKQRLSPHISQMTKALKQLAWNIAEAEGRPCPKERELQDWASVLVELLGPYKPPPDFDAEFASGEKLTEEEALAVAEEAEKEKRKREKEEAKVRKSSQL